MNKRKMATFLAVLVLFSFSVALAENDILYADLKVGDIVMIGRYEQDNNLENGPEPIEWRVLTVEQDRALLVSVCCLDEMSYWDPDDTHGVLESGANWSTSFIRRWLNSEFVMNAFTEEEIGNIPETTIHTNDCSGAFDTKDKAFVLSASEVEQYFHGDEDTSAPITEYARSRVDESRGAVSKEGFGMWWLRDMVSVYKEAEPWDFMSTTFNEAAYVAGNGLEQYREGTGIMIFGSGLFTVRPAIWMLLDPAETTNSRSESSSETKKERTVNPSLIAFVEETKKWAEGHDNGEIVTFIPIYTDRLGLNWYSSAKNRAALTVMLAAEITDANWIDGNHIYSMISFYESYIGKKSSDEYVIIGGSSTGMFEIHYLPNNHTATYKIIQTETSRSALEKSMKSICSKYYINTLKDISEGFDLVQSFIAK